MNDSNGGFVDSLKGIGKKIKIGYAKLVGRKVAPDGSLISTKMTTHPTYEINLVPEVKAKMIRVQKIRNIVLFVCILVSSIAGGVVLVLFGVKSGQDIAMSNQDGRIARMSEKLNEYSELDELVTFQGQLEQINNIISRKTVLSRVFGALGVMLYQGADEVRLSDLRVNLQTNVINMEGQANAKNAPLIDYRVLEAFKKSVELTKYDYGRYVDIDGKEIAAQCIKESDENGNALRVGDSYYAWWDLTIEGCEGSVRDLTEETAETPYHYGEDAEVESDIVERATYTKSDCVEENCPRYFRDDNTEVPADAVYKTEGEGEGMATTTVVLSEQPARVRIWRTPQFAKWYEDENMSLDGNITGVSHFESVCYQYRGTMIGDEPRWTSSNDCLLAPNGITISGSSNGRDESNNLVLRFTASVVFADEFFAFGNKHMIAIGPMGQNVTDSYVQIGGMFAPEAKECDPEDTECLASNARSAGE